MTKRYEGINLRLLYLEGSEYLPALHTVAKQFEAETGAKVVFDGAPSWFYLQPWVKAAQRSTPFPWDIFCNDLEFQYTLGSYFIPLDDLTERSGYDWTGFFRPIIKYGSRMPNGEGARYGLPIRARVPLLFYRSDQIETFPATWDEYERILAEQTTQSGFGLGYVGTAEPLVKMFLARYWSEGNPLLSADWTPQINSDRGVWALEMLVRQLHRYAPPDALGWNRENAVFNFAAGRVAVLEAMTPPAITIIEDRCASRVHGRWSIGQYPGTGNTEFTNHNLFIFKASANPEAAFEFAARATGRISASRLLDAGECPARKNVWLDPDKVVERPYLSQMAENLDRGIPFAPGLPQWLDMVRVLWDAVSRCLFQQETPRVALDEAARQWTDLLPPGGCGFPYQE